MGTSGGKTATLLPTQHQGEVPAEPCAQTLGPEFSKCLLSSYYSPGPVLDAEKTMKSSQIPPTQLGQTEHMSNSVFIDCFNLGPPV